ncbi:MAG: hypothetical protein V1755_08265 [Chloroflexota bacterium]
MRSSLLIIVTATALAGCVIPFSEAASPAVPSGSVLYRDDFASSATGWKRVQNDGGIMDYDGGGYRILVTAPEANVWSTPERDFRDARLEVDAGKLGGPDANRIGLVCRADGTSHYFFIIGSDGYYGLGIFTGGQAALLGQSSMQPSEAIITGTAINHLRLDCSGSALSGYVNGVRVAGVQDQTLTHGEAGVLAGTFDEPGADIVFDNFVVLQP